MAEKYKKDDLVVLGVNFWDEEKETVEAFVREKNLTHPILLNGREVGNRYGVFSIPSNLWINPQGVVVEAVIGFDDPEDLERMTTKLLAGAR